MSPAMFWIAVAVFLICAHRIMTHLGRSAPRWLRVTVGVLLLLMLGWMVWTVFVAPGTRG